MHLFFDPDFAGGAWPGPLGDERQAAAGEAWVGVPGLIGLLEDAFGLGGPVSPESFRVAQVARSARRGEGFWSASAQVDPIAVGRRLLKWRDQLVLYGWEGQGSGRLQALASVCAAAAPGVEDRLRAVALVAEHRGSPISRLTCFASMDELPGWVLRALRALEAQGTEVQYRSPTRASRSGETDLDSHRRWVGDGSLQLLRPVGVLAAADAVAAALADADSLAGTVVLGADPTLDLALHRHGLPRLGRPGALPDNALLELLPLALRLSFSPPDPQRALELLTLPVSPLPRRLAAWLAHSLQEVPAVGSAHWRSTLTEALEAMEETQRAIVSERFGTLLDSVRSPRVPVSLLASKVACLRDWLEEWSAGPRSTQDRAAIAGAQEQLSAFETYLTFCDTLALTEPEVGQLLDEATRYVAPGSHRLAEAGLASVQAPGAVVGPARRIIWWNFTLSTAPPIPSSPFSSSERRELEGVGVCLPDRTTLALQRAARWRRPLLSVEEALVLVTPLRGEDGEPSPPHPLLDELLGRVSPEARSGSLAAIERKAVGLPREPVQVRRQAQARVRGQATWKLPAGAIARRPLESPRSVQLLLGCSLGWVLQYVAGLRGGMTASLPEGPLLHGKLVHALVEAVLRDCPEATVAEAERSAGEAFDSQGPRLAAALFRPGRDREREEVRVATRAATAALYQSMREGGFHVDQIESPLRLSALGGELEGRPDLVLRDKQRNPAVVDLKWGRGDRREELTSGTALQLAAYSRLLGAAGAATVPGAYLILRSQELLTTDPGVFPGSPSLVGPSLNDTWRAVERSHPDALRALEAGEAHAPGIAPSGERLERWKEGLAEQRISLRPPCEYCALEAVCGRTFSPRAEVTR